jgi:predicted DCC family thiol-disulfide oxidoreductase YuxK
VTFVNYFADKARDTPINDTAARFVLGAYLIWKMSWYDWHEVLEAPFVGTEEYAFLIPPTADVLVFEKYLLVVTLLAFMIGYRVRLAAFLSAVLVGHLAGIRFAYNTSGGVTALFIALHFIVFFGIFAHRQAGTVDAWRRTADESLDTLVSRLKASSRGTFSMDALKWSLVALAIVYFGSGWTKLFPGFRLEWAAPWNLSRIIRVHTHVHEQLYLPWFSDLMLQYPSLVGLSAAMTLVLEIGFLVAVLAGVTLTPVVLGLFGMHAVVLLSLGIFFGDVYPFLLMFLSWDRLYGRVVRDRELDLVFDERCFFCARSLLPFKRLDVNETVTFYSQSDVPARYRSREDVDFEEAMYVFDGEHAYEGYFAFRKLLSQFRIFAPFTWLMRRGPVEAVGTKVYERVAANRSRYFTCSVSLENTPSEGD